MTESILLPSALTFSAIGGIILLDISFISSLLVQIIGYVFVLGGVFIGTKLIPRGRVDPQSKAVFITGCDTGFGHGLAVTLDRIGYRVFAGCLFPGKSNQSIFQFFSLPGGVPGGVVTRRGSHIHMVAYTSKRVRCEFILIPSQT